MSSALQVIKGATLAGLTTLGLGGPLEALLKLARPEELEQAVELERALGLKTVVLGRGSNILGQSDGPLPLLAIKADFGPEPYLIEGAELKALRKESAAETAEAETADAAGKTLVRAGCGVPLPALVRFTIENGLAGMAGLAGIPGSLGGAVAMNAGSYGAETGDVLHSVRVFSPEYGFETFSVAELRAAGLGYRHFALPGKNRPAPRWFVIIEAVFAFVPGNKDALKAEFQDCLTRKKATQPVQGRSAGCVFKNPAPGVSAGKLLDEAGFKGKRRGNMAFSDLHANFLLNLRAEGENGKAPVSNAADAMQLVQEAQQAVLEKSGHKLEMEVKLWP